MDPREVIKTHLLLCEDVYSILLEENTWLKTEKQAPTMDLLGRKQVILPQLEDSLANLKKLKPEYFSPFDDSKKLVGQSHAKLLQIFYIDRENEELLLKLSQSTERQTFNRFTTPPEEIDDIHKSLPGQEEEGESDGGEEEPPSPQAR
ncbi:MAG: hypothetical protein HOH60_08730 [Opitutae bacterium]|jgi:hypothetical protein|nr:hypothetical protein [Opitutae bacterium]